MKLVPLALDETTESVHAARVARELFGADATYLAVNVAEQAVPWMPTPIVWGGVYPYTAAATDPASNARDAVQDRARETAHDVAHEGGVAAASVGAIGDPMEAILQAADEHAADVIVVGSSNKGWWRRFLEGSVSDDVVRFAERPVLVVPAIRGD